MRKEEAMREEGTVVGIEGRVARVRMKPGPQCGRCCACSALGGGGLELEIESGLPLKVGSRVAVEIPRGNPWLSALLLFVCPLADMVVAMLISSQLGLSDIGAAAVGFGALVASFAVAAVVDRKLVRPRQGPPTIVEVLGSEGPA